MELLAEKEEIISAERQGLFKDRCSMEIGKIVFRGCYLQFKKYNEQVTCLSLN